MADDEKEGATSKARGQPASRSSSQLKISGSSWKYIGCFHSLLHSPPSCLFVISLVLVCFVLFPIGLYVQNNPDMPDLDIMVKWNSPLGRLPGMQFCAVNKSSAETVFSPGQCSRGACVQVPFLVPHDVLRHFDQKVLIARLSGKDLQSRDESHHLIGNNIYIDLAIPIVGPSSNADQYTVDAYLTYCLGNSSQLELTMQSFQHDRNNSEVSHSGNTNPCPESYQGVDYHEVAAVGGLSTDMSLCHQTLQPRGETFRQRGIVYFFLTQESRSLAAQRMYLTSLLVGALTLLFGLGFCFIDHRLALKS